MREAGKRLPCVLPYGQRYLDNQLQFVHVDDMARLVAWILKREPEAQRLTILNVAGRGEAMSFAQCIQHRACQADTRSRQVEHAPVLQIPLEPEYLVHPARRRSLHDRPIHHEHRPPEKLPEWRLRESNQEDQPGSFHGLFPEGSRPGIESSKNRSLRLSGPLPPRYSPATPNVYGIHETSANPACFMRGQHLPQAQEIAQPTRADTHTARARQKSACQFSAAHLLK